MIEDAHFDPLKTRVLQAVKETALWYQNSSPKDKRNDNLSGGILSRFQDHSGDYNWHIITTEVVSQGAKHCRV